MRSSLNFLSNNGRGKKSKETIDISGKQKTESNLPLKSDSTPVELSDNPEFGAEAWEFHRKRFQEVAKERNKKFSSIFRTKEFREIDSAHEEALRDDAIFRKKNSEAFNRLNEDTKIVIDHFRKKRDETNGEGKKYKTLILAL